MENNMKRIEEITEYYGPILAKGAFELGAIKLSPAAPFTWASGYRMPIYNDNRMFLSSPKYRALIRDAFADMLAATGEKCDNIAGTATAGIPHATSLADMLYKPLSYVRSSSPAPTRDRWQSGCRPAPTPGVPAAWAGGVAGRTCPPPAGCR